MRAAGAWNPAQELVFRPVNPIISAWRGCLPIARVPVAPRSRRKEMMKAKLLASITAVVLLGGCVQQPPGPTVAVMPAPYKPFEVFQQDQAICMAYGNQMTKPRTRSRSARRQSARCWAPG